MRPKVLTFSGLPSLLPLTGSFLKAKEVLSLTFGNWAELARHLHDPDVCVVLLPFGTGEINGVDCCRQIKEREAFRAIRVFLVATGDVGSQDDAAKKVGCDLVAGGSGADPKILEALEDLLKSAPDVAPRSAPRFDMTGQLFYIVGEEARIGEILNASRTGMLFGANEVLPVGTPVLLRMQSTEGSHLDISAVVKRTLTLSGKNRDFKVGIGCQFARLDSHQQQVFDWLLTYREKRVPNWSQEAAMKILKANVHVLVEMLREPTSRAFLDAFAGEIRPFERAALDSDTFGGTLIRGLVATRVQCAAFATFIADMRTRQQSFGSMLFGILLELFERTSVLASQCEKRIQECRDGSQVEELQNLIDSVDRLDAAKLRLLFSVDENLTPEGLKDSEVTALQTLKEQVSVVRKQQRVREVSVTSPKP